jgi:hypothetical protein
LYIIIIIIHDRVTKPKQFSLCALIALPQFASHHAISVRQVATDENVIDVFE